MDKELRVKIVAEGTESFKKDMKQTGDSIKDMSNASKNSTQALDKLKNVIQEQKNKLTQLKTEYANVILTQNKTGKAAADLAQQMKKVNDELLNNQRRVKDAMSASDGFTTALDGSAGIDNTNASMQELMGTVEAIRGMSFAELFIELFNVEAVQEGIAALNDSMSMAGSAFSNMIGEISEALDGDYWEGAADGGATTIGEQLGVLRTQASEVFASMRSGARSVGSAFTALGGVIGAALSSTVAKIGLVVAAIGSMVAAIRGAISVAQTMKTTFYEAQKIGLSTAEYQRWGYVLQSVGVEADVLSDFIKTLSDEQATLREGSEGISKALEQLGMNIDDVVNMSQADLFTETVTRLQQVENQVDRTALAYQIFGEDAAQLANVINMTNGSVQNLMRNYQLLGGEASESLINKSLELQGAISNLKVAWQGLGNTLSEWIMPAITKVIRWITLAIAYVNMFIRTLLGFSVVSSGSASSTNKAAAGISKYTGAINGATKAAEKLKRVTMGFDELNVIPDTSASGSSGGAGGGAGDMGSGGMDLGAPSILSETDLANLEKFREKMEQNREAIQKWTKFVLTATLAWKGFTLAWQLFTGNKLTLGKLLGDLGAFIGLLKEGNSFTAVFGAAFPKISAAIGGVTKALSVAGGAFGTIALAIAAVGSVIYFLKKNWEEVTNAMGNFFDVNIVPQLEEIRNSWESMKQAISDMIPPAVKQFFVDLGKAIGDIVTAIGEFFASIDWMEAIGVVFETVGGIIFSVVSGVIAGAISSLIGMIEGAIQVITGIVQIVTGVVKAIIALCTGDLAGVKDAVSGIVDGVVNLFKGLYDMTIGIVVDFVKGIIDWFTSLWDELVGHSIVPDMVEAIIDWFLSLPKKILTPIKEFVTNLINTFKDMWSNIKAWWSANVAPKFTSTYWKNTFNRIKEAAASKMDEVKNTFVNKWNSIKTWFSTSIAPKFTASYWTNKFSGIKDGARNAFNGVIDAVERAVNSIVNRINGLSWNVPSWVPGIGGQRWGFNFGQVHIPRLAEGGITNGSTIANIGEGGYREAVLPLERNTEWMDTLADKIAARQTATPTILNIDGKTFAQTSIDAINNLTKQTGSLKLILA